ncbi:MAG: sulfatase [Planctomycetota bacterium]|jgi:arylsulfatase A-like enzyme
MKAIMIMFDSLNRHMLPTYGCDWVHAPNFERLAEKSVTFDKSFVGSMPCMPARREIHTGRYNFLHRSWGPIEPFDNSMPEILKENGIYSHLVSDHYHYWEEGGCNYHTRYWSWEIARGQEGEWWKGYLKDPPYPVSNSHLIEKHTNKLESRAREDWVNRYFTREEKDMPQAQTFAMGMEFIENNYDIDNWFLQIETFDPHEPYCVPDKYKELYDFDYSKFDNDWPGYAPVKEGEEDLVQHMRYTNAALISMCDHYLGTILDIMDEKNLWEDTMLIVNTDHGFLLGEHDWWAKCKMPMYTEVSNTPLFIWDPREKVKGERRQSLVQTIDLPASLLDYFNIARPQEMEGVPLRQTIKDDTPVREAGLFGLHGGHVNCTDGKYLYMRAPVDKSRKTLFNYTHMPTHMRRTFPIEEMQTMEAHPGFDFTKGCPVMKIGTTGELWVEVDELKTMLFDLDNDPRTENPITDNEIEEKMINHIIELMKKNDAPTEMYERLGLQMNNE